MVVKSRLKIRRENTDKILMWYVLITLLLFSNFTKAENNVFIRTYSGIINGRYCGRVASEDADKLEKACKYPGRNLLTSSEKIFEWSVFQSSAELQVQKNLCIQQRLSEMAKSPDLQKEWIKDLAKAWLGKKKAQLIVSKCDAINFNTNERLGARLNAGYYPRQTVDPKWLEILSLIHI